MTRRHWLFGAVVGTVGLTAFWLLVGSDEAKILALVRKLIDGAARNESDRGDAYAKRCRALLSEALLSDGVLRAPELNDSLQGPEEISAWASEASAEFDTLRFSLDQTEVKTNGSFAHVLAVITLFAKRAGMELRDTRRVDIRLRKRSEWQIESIDVAEPSVDQPEARP